MGSRTGTDRGEGQERWEVSEVDCWFIIKAVVDSDDEEDGNDDGQEKKRI